MKETIAITHNRVSVPVERHIRYLSEDDGRKYRVKSIENAINKALLIEDGSAEIIEEFDSVDAAVESLEKYKSRIYSFSSSWGLSISHEFYRAMVITDDEDGFCDDLEVYDMTDYPETVEIEGNLYIFEHGEYKAKE